MSLRKCPECQEVISSHAEQCPNCGIMLEPQYGFSKSTKTAIRIFALLGFIINTAVGFVCPMFWVIALICLLIAITLK